MPICLGTRPTILCFSDRIAGSPFWRTMTPTMHTQALAPLGFSRYRPRTFTGMAAMLSAALLAFPLATPAGAGDQPTVELGTTQSYSALAVKVTSTGPTVLNGDLGAHTKDGIIGFPPGIVNGATHAGDAQVDQARTDFAAAYNDARTRSSTATLNGDQQGITLTPGVYTFGQAFALTQTLTLDGQDRKNAIFIFQIDAAMNTASASVVKLINNAKASGFFWQVNGAVTTGAKSTLVGTVLSVGAITLGAEAVLVGRALTQGALTLASNSLTVPCASRGNCNAF